LLHLCLHLWYTFASSIQRIQIAIFVPTKLRTSHAVSLFPQAFFKPTTQHTKGWINALTTTDPALYFLIFQTHFETVLKQKRIKIDSKPNQKSNIFCSFQIKNRPKNHTVAIRVYGLSAGAITP